MKKVALIINLISGSSVPAYWINEATDLTTNEFKIKILSINLASIRNISEAFSMNLNDNR